MAGTPSGDDPKREDWVPGRWNSFRDDRDGTDGIPFDGRSTDDMRAMPHTWFSDLP